MLGGRDLSWFGAILVAVFNALLILGVFSGGAVVVKLLFF